MLCIILYNTPPETYVEYSLSRMLDTGVGVAMALLINWLLPRQRLVRWRRAAALRLGLPVRPDGEGLPEEDN